MGSGDGSSGSGVGSPKMSGASEAPSMRCGPAAGSGREKSRSGVVAGRMEVCMRSAASMVADSNGSTTRVSAASLRRAPRASAWLRAAWPALATPCLEWVAHWRRDEPVTSRMPATMSATTSTSTPTRPMNGLSTAHWASPSSPPCALMYASRKRASARSPEKMPKASAAAASATPATMKAMPQLMPAARPALLLDDEQVGGEAEQERQHEREDPDEPAGGVAQPAAERAAVPAQVEHEGEEDGDGEAGDRAELAAMPRGRGLLLGGRRGARSRA